MTFPVIVTQSAGSSATTSTTSHSVSLPASLVSGNRLIVVLFNNSATATSATLPSGWNSGGSTSNTNRSARMIHKISDGTEGATLAITWANAGLGNYIAYQISGSDSTAPTATFNTITSTTTPASSAVTPAWGALDTSWISVMMFEVGTSTSVTSYPTNYTLGQQYAGNSGSTAVHMGSAINNNNTATETPGTWSVTPAATGLGTTIAIKPAPGGGVTATYLSLHQPMLGM